MAGIRSVLGAVAAAAMAGAVGLAGPMAAAAEPTRIYDTRTAVMLVAVDGDRTLEVSVENSESAGTVAFATLYAGAGGDRVAEGEGTSAWTDTTFSAQVDLVDDAGQPAGTVVVSGTYSVTGPAEHLEQKFNDGNIHVVMEQTWAPVSASNVTALFDGAAWQVVEASGRQLTGYLFVSNPATYVGSGEVVVIAEWSGENVSEFYTDEHGTLTETALYLYFADSPYHAVGVLDLSKPAWEGTLTLFDADGGSPGQVAASATITAGDPVRFVERTRGGYERWTFTPFDVELTVDGPVGPAHVTARLVQIQYAWHTSPLDALQG